MGEKMEYHYDDSTASSLDPKFYDDVVSYYKYKTAQPYQKAAIRLCSPESMQWTLTSYLRILEATGSLTLSGLSNYMEYLRKLFSKILSGNKLDEYIEQTSAIYAIMLKPKEKTTWALYNRYLNNKRFIVSSYRNPILAEYLNGLLRERDFSDAKINKLICSDNHESFASFMAIHGYLIKQEIIACLKFYNPIAFSSDGYYTPTSYNEILDIVRAQPRRYEDYKKFQNRKELREIYRNALPEIIKSADHIERIPKRLIDGNLYRQLIAAGATPSQLLYNFHCNIAQSKRSDSPLDYITQAEFTNYVTDNIGNDSGPLAVLISCAYKKRNIPGKFLMDVLNELPASGAKFVGTTRSGFRMILESTIIKICHQKEHDDDVVPALRKYIARVMVDRALDDPVVLRNLTKSNILDNLNFKELFLGDTSPTAVRNAWVIAGDFANCPKLNNILLKCQKHPIVLTTAEELQLLMTQEPEILNSKLVRKKLQLNLSEDEIDKFAKDTFYQWGVPYHRGASNILYEKLPWKDFSKIGYQLSCNLNHGAALLDAFDFFLQPAQHHRNISIDDPKIINNILDCPDKSTMQQLVLALADPRMLYADPELFMRILNDFPSDDAVSIRILNSLLRRMDATMIPDSIKLALALKGTITQSITIKKE